MSGDFAIAAVTTALRDLLAQGISPDPELADTIFTTRPLDQARSDNATANQINLFLYRTAPSAAWRNLDLPDRTPPGEVGMPPLALTLSYLVTVYGRDDDALQPFSHRLLGRALGLLHDHPVLTRGEIAAALPNPVPASRFERVHLTMQPLSLDEISRLWNGFRTQYRLSASYEASAVLIESARPRRTALPVLRRGEDDRGAMVQGDMVPPFPALYAIRPASPVPLAGVIALEGANLTGGRAVVRLTREGRTWDLDPAGDTNDAGEPSRLAVTLPTNIGLTIGVHAVSVVVETGGRTAVSNALAVAIAPRIATPLPIEAERTDGVATIVLDCIPPVGPDQRAALLLGSREFPAAPRTKPQKRLSFAVTGIAPGDYVLRLRVDGIDSAVIADPDAAPSFFDAKAVARIKS